LSKRAAFAAHFIAPAIRVAFVDALFRESKKLHRQVASCGKNVASARDKG
jgi:hypothetical protein